MATAHVFIDTNVALHFQRPDQIDWKMLAGSDCVVLVVAPILLKELQEQKIHNPSRKLRERADAFIRWLRQFVREPSRDVRDGVRWCFVRREPLVDFLANGLSTNVADDRLIASVLDYQPEDGSCVYVATDDIGLEVKLGARAIAVLSLPENLRLPVEPDPIEKENQELRRQLAQRRMPALVLTWHGGDDHCRLAMPPVITQAPANSLDHVRAQYPFLEKREEKPFAADNQMAKFARIAGELQRTLVPPDAIDRYNEQLRVYLGEYKNYLELLLEWERARALTLPLKLTLINRGNLPASQIDVVLTFPDDLLLLEEDDLPEPPESPEAPAKPGVIDLFAPRFDNLNHLFSRPDNYQFELDGVPSVDNDAHKVRFGIRSLKHAFDETLEGFWFRFATRETVQSFQVQYHLSAAEMPEAVTGVLHVVFDGNEG